MTDRELDAFKKEMADLGFRYPSQYSPICYKDGTWGFEWRMITPTQEQIATAAACFDKHFKK